MDSREDLQSNKPPVIVAFSMSQWVENTPAMQETKEILLSHQIQVWSLDWVDSPGDGNGIPL